MKLFLRIFLSFWLATILMVVALFTVSDRFSFLTSEDRRMRFDPDLASESLSKAINTYEQRGATAFLAELDVPITIRHSTLLLVDQNGSAIVKAGRISPSDMDMAKDALDSGRSELIRFGLRTHLRARSKAPVVTVMPTVMSITGHRIRASNPRVWFDLAVAMLSTSLVCLALSFYLTRPHHQAEGDGTASCRWRLERPCDSPSDEPQG